MRHEESLEKSRNVMTSEGRLYLDHAKKNKRRKEGENHIKSVRYGSNVFRSSLQIRSNGCPNWFLITCSKR